MADPVTLGTRGSDFARLVNKITEAGLLNRRPVYYAIRMSLVMGAYLGAWALFVWVGDSWWQLLVAVLLAVVSTQIGFVAHDVGHRQVFRTRRASDMAGVLFGNLGIGLGWGWWNNKHNRHHANPNHEDHDPDVSPSVIVWSQDQLGRTTAPGPLHRQAAGLLVLPAAHPRRPGTCTSPASERCSSPRPSAAAPRARCWPSHFVLYFGLIFTVLPVGKALAFIVVHQALFGLYLGCSFAPNHKGMPILTAEDQLDFLRKQVLTSRNVRGGVFTDVLLGGLNYQIEHHLFPNMPAPNLRQAQPIVRRYCEELGVSYLETGLIKSYSQALGHLHEVGAPLR